MKKKYFVLRDANEERPPTFDYYDSEKKFRANAAAPKRSINVRTCFAINKKPDAKNKFAFALYTRNECLALAAENEAELNDWLSNLQRAQQGEAACVGSEVAIPKFGECPSQSSPKRHRR